jgi:hypothetical protein
VEVPPPQKKEVERSILQHNKQSEIYLACIIKIIHTEPGYLSGIALGYGLDDRGCDSRQGPGIFLFTTVSKPAVGPTQPPIQRVPGALSLRVKQPGMKLTIHLHLAPRSRMRGAIHPLPQYAFIWCLGKAHGLYLFTYRNGIKVKLSLCFFNRAQRA